MPILTCYIKKGKENLACTVIKKKVRLNIATQFYGLYDLTEAAEDVIFTN